MINAYMYDRIHSETYFFPFLPCSKVEKRKCVILTYLQLLGVTKILPKSTKHIPAIVNDQILWFHSYIPNHQMSQVLLA